MTSCLLAEILDMTTHESCVQGDALFPSDFLQNPKLRAAIAACAEPEPDPAYPRLVASQILLREKESCVEATPSTDARGRREQDEEGRVEVYDAVLFDILQQDAQRSEMRSHVRLWLRRLDQLANAVFR